MHQTLFYGEIASHITNRIYQHPDRILQIDKVLDLSEQADQTVFNLVGQSAHVFATIQDLFNDEAFYWMKALELYSESILDMLLVGERPQTLDLLQMNIHSLHAVS